MKNIITNSFLPFLIIFFLLGNSSCKDDEPGNMMEEEQATPSTFTQKSLFEKISYEQCGACPAYTNLMLDFIDEKPENSVFSVSIQYGDAFAITHAADIIKHFSNFSGTIAFPAFALNRDFNGETDHLFQSLDTWEEIIDNHESKEAVAGLAINSTVDGGRLDVEVSFTSNEEISDAYLSVYIYEDNVPESSPGAQQGVIGSDEYLHSNILRQVPTQTLGTPVNITVGEESTLAFENIDLSGLEVANVGVIAFLHYSNEPYDIQIINVQQTKAGENQDFD